MKQIHNAHVHHCDIYPKNILIVPGAEERMVRVDFDVATMFSNAGPDEQRYSEYEEALVAGFGDALVCFKLQLFYAMEINLLSSERTKTGSSEKHQVLLV